MLIDPVLWWCALFLNAYFCGKIPIEYLDQLTNKVQDKSNNKNQHTGYNVGIWKNFIHFFILLDFQSLPSEASSQTDEAESQKESKIRISKPVPDWFRDPKQIPMTKIPMIQTKNL